MSKLLVERREAVTLLTINRPEVHNCVDGETAAAIATAIKEFKAGDSKVLVVTGAGGRAFCSGADLKSGNTLMSHPFVDEAGPMGFARLDPEKPTIAAVEGYCFAGGMELAAWCDFRIASETAEFGALNRRWGVPFVDGGTQRFARIVGAGNALYLLETGIKLGAAKALQMGLVQEVVAAGEALSRALELAGRITDYPQASLRADRAAAIATWGVDLDEGLLLEASMGRSTVDDPEMAEGLRRFATGDRPAPPTERS